MSKSIQKLIDEQIKRWEMDRKESPPIQESVNVITISREAGSQGQAIAERLCEKTGFSLFHNEIVQAMVEESKNSRMLLETLDERGMNVVEDLVSNFVNERHLWPDEYSRVLYQVLSTIGSHGNAVILGRGAGFVLEGPRVLKVRIVAPVKARREFIQNGHDLNAEDAERYQVSKDANRTAFVRRYFNVDADDPSLYDLVLNTGTLSLDQVVQIIQCAMR